MLKLALQSLWARRLTAGLTLLAVAISVTLLLGVERVRSQARDSFANTVSGVDLIVGHRPNRLAIQCKRLSRPVGPGAVQEVVAGAPMQDCAATMVVSNQPFTPAARRLAELHGCELVGGSELPRLRSVIRRLTEPGPVS